MPNVNIPAFWLMDGTQRELSDLDFRVHISGLMQSMSQLSDGVLPRNVLPLLHPDGLQPESYERLVQSGLWQHHADGYAIANWSDTQTTKEVYLRQKKKSAESSARSRQKKAAELESQIQARADELLAQKMTALGIDPVTGDVTGHVTDVALGLGIGLDLGLGESRNRREVVEAINEAPSSDDWPTVPIPASSSFDSEEPF